MMPVRINLMCRKPESEEQSWNSTKIRAGEGVARSTADGDVVLGAVGEAEGIESGASGQVSGELFAELTWPVTMVEA